MTTQYDEKGKIFTEVISKRPVPVIIRTVDNIIHGTVYARPDIRLIDELNASRNRFAAVTDVTVLSLEKVALYQSSFLVISIDQIVWIIPQDELIQE